MKRIIFRGRIAASREWVYGYYMEVNGEHRIYTGEPEENKNDGKRQYSIVEKDTVGLYTGIRDRKGAMIYEGDIVRGTYKSMIGIHGEEVHYERGGFYPFSINGWEGTPFVAPVDNGVYDLCDSVEVVGNIHDTEWEYKHGHFY